MIKVTDLVFGDAHESDAEQIGQAAAQSWRATYKDIFAPEFIERFLAINYSPESLRRSIQDPRSTFLVACSGMQIIGFCHFGYGQQGAELFRLYVIPTHWRLGIGKQLVHLMESRWVMQNVSEYFCYVHKRNEIGKAFYLKMGFVHDPIRDRDDEWYMRRQIP